MLSVESEAMRSRLACAQCPQAVLYCRLYLSVRYKCMRGAVRGPSRPDQVISNPLTTACIGPNVMHATISMHAVLHHNSSGQWPIAHACVSLSRPGTKFTGHVHGYVAEPQDGPICQPGRKIARGDPPALHQRYTTDTRGAGGRHLVPADQ